MRFEGPGNFGGSTVQGHLAETRITVISGSTVTSRHLNKHINYNVRPGVALGEEAQPGDADRHGGVEDGATLYVAAFGSSKIGVFPTATLENNTLRPDAPQRQLPRR